MTDKVCRFFFNVQILKTQMEAEDAAAKLENFGKENQAVKEEKNNQMDLVTIPLKSDTLCTFMDLNVLNVVKNGCEEEIQGLSLPFPLVFLRTCSFFKMY